MKALISSSFQGIVNPSFLEIDGTDSQVMVTGPASSRTASGGNRKGGVAVGGGSGSGCRLTVKEMLTYASQIASGMVRKAFNMLAQRTHSYL